MIVAAVTVLLVGLAMALRRRIDSGLLGIALVMMMDLGQMLSLLIQNWMLLATSMGAIARINNTARDTPCEETADAVAPPEWPADRTIAFFDAEIRWNETVVLREICLDIRAGENIGLCGRTGSGKNSLVQSLLRLNEVTAGRILIDGQDISTAFPLALRQRIAATHVGILILDKPTASLDRDSDAVIQRLIEEALGHCTVLVVAHHISSPLKLDRVAVMDAGRLAEVGPPRAFFSMLARGANKIQES